MKEPNQQSHLTMSEAQFAEYMSRAPQRSITNTPPREQDGKAATPGPAQHAEKVLKRPETAQGQCVTLTLPKPVSANLYWRTFLPKGHSRPIVTLSDQAKNYKAQVKLIARQAGITKPISGRVELSIELYPDRPLDWARRAAKNPAAWDDDVRCIDLDNCLKVAIDAIKGVVIDDDKWVRKIIAERMEPDGDGRLVITVRKIVLVELAQAALRLEV